LGEEDRVHSIAVHALGETERPTLEPSQQFQGCFERYLFVPKIKQSGAATHANHSTETYWFARSAVAVAIYFE
jgi:hypothetical protein